MVTNWSLTLAIDFTWAQVNLHGHRPECVCAQACAHVATHIQCMHNTHLLGELGHTPAMKFYTDITSEAVFGHKYHSFSHTCELTSRPYESDHTC